MCDTVRGTRACLLLAMLVTVAGCGSPINENNLGRIKTGMTLAEVKAILGPKPSPVYGRMLGVSPNHAMLEWRDGDKSIVVMFEDGEVVRTAHAGL